MPSGRSSRRGRTPRAAASLLRAIGRTDSVKYAFQVRNRLKDDHREVKAAAAFAAARLDLDRETAGSDRGPTIATSPTNRPSRR